MAMPMEEMLTSHTGVVGKLKEMSKEIGESRGSPSPLVSKVDFGLFISPAEIFDTTGEFSPNKLTGGKRMKNTSLPWKVDEATDLPIAVIQDNEDGIGIAEIGPRNKRSLFLAEFIVKACNAHNDLLEACKLALEYLYAEGCDEFDSIPEHYHLKPHIVQLNKAIKKAT